MFEETLPAGTASLYHLHRDSDEVAWVLPGQLTFKNQSQSGGTRGEKAILRRTLNRPAYQRLPRSTTSGLNAHYKREGPPR